MTAAKVLLVDDDPDILKIASLSLVGKAQWQVATATSGKEALQLAPQHKPDLIVIDTALTDTDGISLMQQFKETADFKETPIVLTTTKIEDGEEAFYISKGAKGLIEKPFNPDTLVDLLVQKVNA